MQNDVRLYNVITKSYSNKNNGKMYNVSMSPPRRNKDPHANYNKFLEYVSIRALSSSSSRSSSSAGVRNKVVARLGRWPPRSYKFKKFGRYRTVFEKDRSNILRAKRQIKGIALANDWDYFVTFTIDGKKADRTDYSGTAKRMVQYLRDLRKEGYNIQYVLVPELHGDGENFHFHGFISGLPDHLLSEHPLSKHRAKGYRDFPSFASRFGFVTMAPFDGKEFAIFYILKYIDKSLAESVRAEGMHLYYVSRGVNRPKEITRFTGLELSTTYLANNFNMSEFGTAYADCLNDDTYLDVMRDYFFGSGT